MSTIIANSGDTIPLFLVLNDGQAGLFPRATIRNSSGFALATVNLSDLGGGIYLGSYTVPSSSKFLATYIVYSDSGHTHSLVPTRTIAEDLIVSDFSVDPTSVSAAVWDAPQAGHRTAGSFGEALMVLLGTAGKSNFRIDNMTYATTGFLQSARLRIFPDEATAASSTIGGTGEGEISTLTVTGSPDGIHVSLPTTVLGLR